MIHKKTAFLFAFVLCNMIFVNTTVVLAIEGDYEDLTREGIDEPIYEDPIWGHVYPPYDLVDDDGEIIPNVVWDQACRIPQDGRGGCILRMCNGSGCRLVLEEDIRKKLEDIARPHPGTPAEAVLHGAYENRLYPADGDDDDGGSLEDELDAIIDMLDRLIGRTTDRINEICDEITKLRERRKGCTDAACRQEIDRQIKELKEERSKLKLWRKILKRVRERLDLLRTETPLLMAEAQFFTGGGGTPPPVAAGGLGIEIAWAIRPSDDFVYDLYEEASHGPNGEVVVEFEWHFDEYTRFYSLEESDELPDFSDTAQILLFAHGSSVVLVGLDEFDYVTAFASTEGSAGGHYSSSPVGLPLAAESNGEGDGEEGDPEDESSQDVTVTVELKVMIVGQEVKVEISTTGPNADQNADLLREQAGALIDEALEGVDESGILDTIAEIEYNVHDYIYNSWFGRNVRAAIRDTGLYALDGGPFNPDNIFVDAPQ